MTSPLPVSTGSRSAADSCLVLFGLWGLAVAQPLFDLLGKTTAFFVAHSADRTDLLLFALAVSLVGPAILSLVIVLARRLSSPGGWGRWLEIAAWALLAATLAAPWMSDWPLPAWGTVGLALSTGTLAALTLDRWAPAHTLARWLGSAAWVFPLLFLFVSPAHRIDDGPDPEADAPAQAEALRPVTAVLLVLDEFPLVSLLDDRELIDAERFPSFAALAETATWYRNATTVAQSTAYAVPAILSGRYPEAGKTSQPVWSDYKRNLFTIIGQRANLHVVETMSRLCPSKLCSGRAHLVPRRVRLRAMTKDASAVYLHLVAPRGWRARLPEIGETWRDFWTAPEDALDSPSTKANEQESAAAFDRFLEDISAFPPPALHYLHLMAPHLPWNRLPDGTTYLTRKRVPHGLEHQAWQGSEWETTQAHQRHLLQVGWVDGLIGRLREELEDRNRWDDAIVIVTSDHGTSFETGGRRRNLTSTNFSQIVNVPLFVKYPGQTEGRIDDSNVETIDVMPTLLEALGAPSPPALPGHDLAGPRRRESKTVYSSGLRGAGPGRAQNFTVKRVLDRRQALARKIDRFGTGTWDTVFAAGFDSDLVGRSIEAIRGADAPPAGPRVHLDRGQDFDDIDLSHEALPVHITGSLRSEPGADPLILALALNGVVRATTQTFQEGKRWRFSALVPRSALVAGPNSVDILQVNGPPEDRRVRRLRTASASTNSAEDSE